MAICQECKQQMTTATSCTYPYIKLDGKWYKRNTSYYDVNRRCHDCGIVNHHGNVHHYGCDMERCPKCKGQLISCGCHHKTQLASALPSENIAHLKNKIKQHSGLNIAKETQGWN